MTTITANYSWQMPDPGGSANTWGNTLNGTTQSIDAQVHTNQAAIANVVNGSTPLTNVVVSGNVTASSINSTGNIGCATLVATGDIDSTGGNVNGANLNAKQNVTAAYISSTGAIQAGANITADGDIDTANGNVNCANMNATQHVTCTFLNAGSGPIYCGPLTASGAISAGSISTGSISATGAIGTSASMNCNNLTVTNNITCAYLNDTGNLFCAYLSTNGGLIDTNTLHSTGDITVGGNLNSNNAVNAQGNMTCVGNAYKTGGGSWLPIGSDARIKTVTGEYEPGLDEAIRLRPVVYTFKGNDGPAHQEAAAAGKSFIGLIADEVLPIIPDMVEIKRGVIDGREVNDYKTLDPSQLIYMLINAVKELKAEVEALKAAR